MDLSGSDKDLKDSLIKLNPYAARGAASLADSGGSSFRRELPRLFFLLWRERVRMSKAYLDHPSHRPLFARATCNRSELFPLIRVGAAETAAEIPAYCCQIPQIGAARTIEDVVEIPISVPV